MGFPKQEYRRRLPFPSPEDLPNPGIEPMSLVSSALLAGSLPTEPPGKPIYIRVCVYIYITSMIREVRVHLDFKFWEQMVLCLRSLLLLCQLPREVRWVPWSTIRNANCGFRISREKKDNRQSCVWGWQMVYNYLQICLKAGESNTSYYVYLPGEYFLANWIFPKEIIFIITSPPNSHFWDFCLLFSLILKASTINSIIFAFNLI